MGYARRDVEKTKKIAKKFVRYQEGAELYSIGLTKLNNPVPVSLLSGDRKPQIRFLGNHHSGSGNLYHKSFRM